MTRKASNREHSAGVIPFRWLEGEWHVLLLRAYRYWDFPKGRVEQGETALATAVREAAEEAGLNDLDFRWGHRSYRTEAYSKNKVAEYFVAETRTENVVLGINPELGRPEHHEGRWFSIEGASARLNDRVRRALEWGLATVAGE